MGMRSVKDVLVGALVGIVSMLPGASGATIAVIFGIYERLVSDLADLRHRLLKDVRFILLIGIGIVLGMLICAFGLEFLIDNYEIPTMFFFAALIVSQIPDIKKLGDDGEPLTKYNILAFIVGLAIMVSFLFIDSGESADLEGTSGIILMVLIGVIFAVSKLAPGVSGSTILLALGFYEPFMHAMTDLDMHMLIPVGIGLIVGVLGFSKVIDHFMHNNRKSTYIMILGLTAGSVITVTADAIMMMDGTDMILFSVVGIILGLVLGILLSKVAYTYAKETIPSSKE